MARNSLVFLTSQYQSIDKGVFSKSHDHLFMNLLSCYLNMQLSATSAQTEQISISLVGAQQTPCLTMFLQVALMQSKANFFKFIIMQKMLSVFLSSDFYNLRWMPLSFMNKLQLPSWISQRNKQFTGSHLGAQAEMQNYYGLGKKNTHKN